MALGSGGQSASERSAAAVMRVREGVKAIEGEAVQAVATGGDVEGTKHADSFRAAIEREAVLVAAMGAAMAERGAT